MHKIKIGWLLFGFIALALGIWGYSSGTVFVYGRVKGIYSVTEIDDRVVYWTFTMMHFHSFFFCLFISVKEYYPRRVKELMSFSMASSLSMSQVCFILFIAGVFFGSNFYISQIIANA